MEIEDLVERLLPGTAFVSPGMAILKRYSGALVGVRDGCDEPLIYELKDADSTLAWLDRWHVRFWPECYSSLANLPNDIDEVHWVIRLMNQCC